MMELPCSCYTNKEGPFRDLRLQAPLAAGIMMTEAQKMEWREQGKISIINLDYSRGDFGLFQRSAWKNAMQYVSGETRG